MKKKISFLAAILLTTTLLGCNNTNNHTSKTSTSPAPTTTSPSETSTITIAEANEIATQAGSTLTTEKYLISGTIENVQNQYIEMEVALCNWNNKSTHRACVLSITVNGEKLVNNLNFIY